MSPPSAPSGSMTMAVSLLLRAGLSNVSNLVGGLAAWQSAQLATTGAER